MMTPAARASIHVTLREVMTVRKLALFGAIAALWLFVAAASAFADGGPHQMGINNGTAGISADSCAGCHRAHTATAAYLLNSDQPDLCLNCHNGSMATTDVLDGVQYSATAQTLPVLGALRGGGFQYALIDSSNAARLSYASGANVRNIGHVQPLATKAAITSTHGGTGGIYSAGWGNGTVWGNGAVGTGAGATVSLECASCHNPHGNGQYRILQTTPALTASSGTYTVSIANGVQVTDTSTGGTHNYTIRPATDGNNQGGSAALLVGGTSGDYWRYHWDPTGALAWNLTSGGPGADQMNTGWNGTSAVNAKDYGTASTTTPTGLLAAGTTLNVAS
ncbi:MAG TPA: cytochrome c3 family protein, partial [Mycobacterium sp.]|nr:cytochrome c3 family protein [Mycobacterium sp.]